MFGYGSSLGLCSGSSSLEDSCCTLYISPRLQDTGCGTSVGGSGGGRFCCASSLSVHHPGPYLFCLGYDLQALLMISSAHGVLGMLHL